MHIPFACNLHFLTITIASIPYNPKRCLSLYQEIVFWRLPLCIWTYQIRYQKKERVKLRLLSYCQAAGSRHYNLDEHLLRRVKEFWYKIKKKIWMNGKNKCPFFFLRKADRELYQLTTIVAARYRERFICDKVGRLKTRFSYYFTSNLDVARQWLSCYLSELCSMRMLNYVRGVKIARYQEKRHVIFFFFLLREYRSRLYPIKHEVHC